ncbi:MAG: hypothetical protein LC118_21380 [Dehalococcoidia bacterium]|nr:hypothetical protein [Dehalococcoidia bacterium]
MAKSDRTATRRALDRLTALRRDPVAGPAFALELLESFDDPFVVEAAIAALGTPPPPARPILVRRLRDLMASGTKRDPGGLVRAALLGALDDLLAGEDIELARLAATTCEPTPGDPAAPTVLRAAGLVALDRLDPVLAAAYAVTALAAARDPRRTSAMTGEPAATAARVLAAQDRWDALLLFVLQDTSGTPAEVVAEAIRGISGIPPEVASGLIAPLMHDRREIVQLGICDLLVALPEGPAGPAATSFITALRSIEVYAYLLTVIIASRRHDLFAAVAGSLVDERDPRRLGTARSALELATHEPSTPGIIARIDSLLMRP